MPGSRDLLLNFGTPLISLERLKIQTSNFAGILTVRDTKGKNERFAIRGRGLGHVTYFSNFGTFLISLELLKIQTSNFACWWKVRLNQK